MQDVKTHINITNKEDINTDFALEDEVILNIYNGENTTYSTKVKILGVTYKYLIVKPVKTHQPIQVDFEHIANITPVCLLN